MNRFNPYCVYMFKNHKVSVAKKRSKMKKTPIFRGEGECKFRDCKNKCKFSMDGNYLVNVEISSKVKHHMLESHARPVRGNLRQITRKLFEHEQKPYKHYLKKCQDTPTDAKIAGNFSNFGNTTRTFQQIASESRYQNRLDPEEFESVCKLRVRMEKEIEGQKNSGFIQHIVIWPPYWSENGIRIWHDVARSGILYWDATYSILSHRDDKFKYYHYELACSNPVKGQPAIPVSSLISSLYSTSLVRFWLAEFRRAEKKLFGHANASIPHQVNSDRSMAFIQAALSEFNNEDLNAFRTRAFRIISSCAEDGDIHGIFPHACLSHVMASFRKTALECYKSNYEFGMYCFSVLLNSSKLEDVEEILHAIYYVLSSKVLDDKPNQYLELLQSKIATFGSY